MYQSLEDFASTRQKAVNDGLESRELAALMVEKFAEGMNACGTDKIHQADQLCESIDPNYQKNRRLRYERFATLTLTARQTK
ncbi:hypothetical protein [Hydrogenovibrio marinus]|uniref:Uncharacterized protein n=1 Tax=Hydrogenovibrio marinus TaxID=28885 RepID=A0A066ZMK7_HYDMR|nr:hypothetical protein [Hydrogenovibrio marinus]KDN94707.1 hypothetical protein EI16_12485 [Hydrogenovibrio marinus]